jgi:hypothetical protein
MQSTAADSAAPHFFISHKPTIEGTQSIISMKLFGWSGWVRIMYVNMITFIVIQSSVKYIPNDFLDFEISDK